MDHTKKILIANLIIQSAFLSTPILAMYNPNNNNVTNSQVGTALQNVGQMDQQIDQMIQEVRLQHRQGNTHSSLQPQIEQIELLHQQYELILQILQQDDQQQFQQTQQQMQFSNHQQLLQMLQQSQQFNQQINNNLFQGPQNSNPYQILSLIQQTHYPQPLQSSIYPNQQPDNYQSTQILQQSIQNLLQKLNQLKQEIQ